MAEAREKMQDMSVAVGPVGLSLSTDTLERWAGGALLGGVWAGREATASLARFSLGHCGARPSRATIARIATQRLGIAALRPIGHEAANSDETQHWPELAARTNAPCHTHTAAPPGLPTSAGHWKALPEGRASEHEDENGIAA